MKLGMGMKGFYKGGVCVEERQEYGAPGAFSVAVVYRACSVFVLLLLFMIQRSVLCYV